MKGDIKIVRFTFLINIEKYQGLRKNCSQKQTKCMFGHLLGWYHCGDHVYKPPHTEQTYAEIQHTGGWNNILTCTRACSLEVKFNKYDEYK
jgi:hypothetical protein